MKKIAIVWGILALLLVGSLTFFGFKLKENNKPYRALENDLIESAEAYIGQYPDVMSSNEITLTNEELIDHGYSHKISANKEKCTGYIVMTKNMGLIDYKPYIKCDKYTTRGYTD